MVRKQKIIIDNDAIITDNSWWRVRKFDSVFCFIKK